MLSFALRAFIVRVAQVRVALSLCAIRSVALDERLKCLRASPFALSIEAIGIRRRDFISLIGSAVLTRSREALAQEKVYRIGMLEMTPRGLNVANINAFRKGLREFGLDEGRDFVIEYRSADGHVERFPELATALAGLPVDLILARGTPASLAAMQVSNNIQIPVVMTAVSEPIGSGLVVNLARPGGNVTGLSSFVAVLDSKRIQLLRDVVPRATRIAALLNMANPVHTREWDEIATAAHSLDIEPHLLDTRRPEDLATAFEIASGHHDDAVVVGIDTVTELNPHLVAELAASHRLPAIYASRDFVDAGGLLAYGVSYPELYHRAAYFVDKILSGNKPATRPVEQPTRFELTINLKAAKALGIAISQTHVAQADAVIE
jgi:putative ABC transport system substrate-binding protein